MVVIGIDAHKRSHTLVAVDAIGRVRDSLVIEAGRAEYTEPWRGRESASSRT